MFFYNEATILQYVEHDAIVKPTVTVKVYDIKRDVNTDKFAFYILKDQMSKLLLR